MVEWKKIGEISSKVFAGGTPNTMNKEYYDGDIPWIRSGEIDFNVIKSAKRNITKAGYDNSSAKLIRKGSVVMAMTGATVAKTAILEFETSANQSVCAIETNEEIAYYKYVYYILSKDYFKIKTNAQGALTSLNLAMIKQIEIPLPPIEEQKNIVAILDIFNSSIENLKVQIQLRRKQFDYYREKLLDRYLEDGVGLKRLYSFSRIKVGPFGSLIHKEDYITGGIPLVNPVQMVNGHIIRDDKFTVPHELASQLYNYFLKTGDIVFARRGEIGRCAIVTEKEDYFLCGTGSLFVRFDGDVNSKFMLHMFNTSFCRKYLERSAIGGSMLNINCDIVGNMPVPVLPLSEQQRIVDILDKFEASIQNLETQLKLREKQYEYYRNKLLTFD